MRSVEILREEHLWIRRLIGCLEEIATLARDGLPPAEETRELFTLFLEFADGTHQDKEEVYLFPQLLTRANAKETRLLERLVRDHREDRVLLAGLRSKVDAALLGDETSRREFVRHAGEYVREQRRHMSSENAVMLPLAERLLTDEEDRRLTAGFERLDRTVGSKVAGRLRERIEALCARLGRSDASGLNAP